MKGFTLAPHDWWTLATAIACSVACAVVGCFLVLRRQSLLGDAISHAILPGLAGAFIITGSRAPTAMLAGAMAVGGLTAALSEGLRRRVRLAEDAALGVVFTGLFALGVVLITFAARDVDLDPGCVLYGVIELTPFDTVSAAGLEMPRAFVWLSIVLAVNALAIGLCFKELKIASFDPGLAATVGMSPAVVHYGLAALVAGTAVASFEAVGSILVVAMLVAPGATAHLLTDRLSRMVWIAAAVAALDAVIGYAAALRWNTSVAGAMAASAGLVFVLAWLLAPRHGVLGRRAQLVAVRLRIAREDLLGDLYRARESAERGDEPERQAEAPGWLAAIARRQLEHRGLVERSGREIGLTEAGLARASEIVRAHRLWEAFLAERVGLPPDHLHDPAHRVEHFLTPEIRESLGRDVQATQDPHGRPIPP